LSKNCIKLSCCWMILQDSERVVSNVTEDEVSLTLSKVLPSDEGEYSCRLNNKAGASTASAYLYLQRDLL
jgi:hypothetical protein